VVKVLISSVRDWLPDARKRFDLYLYETKPSRRKGVISTTLYQLYSWVDSYLFCDIRTSSESEVAWSTWKRAQGPIFFKKAEALDGEHQALPEIEREQIIEVFELFIMIEIEKFQGAAWTGKLKTSEQQQPTMRDPTGENNRNYSAIRPKSVVNVQRYGGNIQTKEESSRKTAIKPPFPTKPTPL